MDNEVKNKVYKEVVGLQHQLIDAHNHKLSTNVTPQTTVQELGKIIPLRNDLVKVLQQFNALNKDQLEWFIPSKEQMGHAIRTSDYKSSDFFMVAPEGIFPISYADVMGIFGMLYYMMGVRTSIHITTNEKKKPNVDNSFRSKYFNVSRTPSFKTHVHNMKSGIKQFFVNFFDGAGK